jgi:GTPase
VEFHALGVGEPLAIAASHGQGCRELIEHALAGLAVEESRETNPSAIRIAIVGRPNVGKSTLVNRLLGEERVIASEEPGTTRDPILVPFRRGERDFVLIDTAGVRRRARIEDAVERVSVAKTLQAIEQAHVVVLVLDAHDSVTEQDASVLGIALERGRALLAGVNKWDGIAPERREDIRRQLALKVDFAPFVPLFFISARHGTGVGELMHAAVRAFDASMREMPTPELTRTLEQAIAAQPPPLVRGRRIKLKFAHQGGKNPPRIIVHGNQTESVPGAYRRYLSNVFRQTFDLYATPVKMEFRTDANPYAKAQGRARGRRTSR